MSKNVRPLVLVWCIIVFSFAGILDSVETIPFHINELWNDTFEKVMMETKIGEVSKPFKSAFGWHFLKVLDRREKNISDERLKDKAFGILFQRKYREQLQNTLEEIRSEAFVDIKISS